MRAEIGRLYDAHRGEAARAPSRWFEALAPGYFAARRIYALHLAQRMHALARVLGEGEPIDVFRAVRGMTPRGTY